MRCPRRTLALAFLLALSSGACATAHTVPSRMPEPGRTLGVSDIRRLNARDAWQALSRAGLNLDLVEDRWGDPVAVVRRNRGDLGGGYALVVLDSAPVPYLAVLRGIPAGTIESIRVVDKLGDLPLEAPFGRRPSVVIHVTTRRPTR